ARPVPPGEPTGPGTAVEAELCALVARIVGADGVRPGDNFFDIGGHSVLATLLARQIRRAFDVTVPMRAIFEAGTLAELARTVALARASGA
ncbi:phosphopantetheine-binding protein, partial [Streptomyces clavuligerus]